MRNLKKHYKMYKSGKNWCYMAIATLALGVGLFNAGTVHADTNNENSQQDTAQVVSNNQSAVMHSAQEQNSTVIATVANGTHNNSSQIGDYSSNNVADSKVTTQVTQPTVQNGWVKDSNGQMTYYQNGQVSSGRQYVKLPTMPNTNVSGNTNWYLTDNGVAQSGLQEWMGSHYYFDPQTYQVVKNTYVDPNHDNSGYLLGKDGIALNGIQKWQGTYYAFDKTTYRLVKNQKFQEWGYTYQIDDQGRVVSGLYKDNNGDVYYYNPSSYLAETNTYIVPAGTKNGYLFGSDGKALTGVQKWQGTYYYFDPVTKQLVRNNYVKSQWGLYYMFGDDGMIVTGPHMWQGSMYYFDPSSYLVVKNDYRVPAGSDRGYLLGNDGRALTGVQKWQGTFYYFDPATYLLSKENYVKSQWGDWYMVGNDGRIVSGPYKWQGSIYYFDPSSYLMVTNTYRVPAGSKAGYLLGSDGRALTGFQKWQGTTYFFTPSSGLLVQNSKFYYNGHLYWADANGFISDNSSFSNSINQYIVNNHIGHANITQQWVIPANITGKYRGTSNGLPNMVIVHETANPNDSIQGEINYEAHNYNNAFVHAFIDGNNIIQISSTDHEAWGAAYPANGRAVQFEQVEVHNANEFAKELSNAAYFTAYEMHKYGMTPSLGGTLYSHHMVSETFGGTDHTDPDGYWATNARMFGTTYNMNDFYELVQAYYAAI